MPHNIKLNKIKHEPMKGLDMPMSMNPMFHVSDKEMPEIKNWEVGNKYKLVIEVEQKSKSEDEMGVHAGFEIVAYKHLKDKSLEEMSDKEFGEYQSKVMSKQ